MRNGLLAAFLSLFFLSGCLSFAGGSTPVAVDAAETARLVNAFRHANRLDAVEVDATLTGIAAAQARAMAAQKTMSHSVGGEFSRRLRGGGYQAAAAAENIAMGYRSLASVMAVWQQSPGHRRNLLNRQVTEFGIAAAADDEGRIYWAIVLGEPQPR